MSGRRVLIVDDVITAGTAIRESVHILKTAGASLVAVAVCLDRQEKTSETSNKSAIQVLPLYIEFKLHLLFKLNERRRWKASSEFRCSRLSN